MRVHVHVEKNTQAKPEEIRWSKYDKMSGKSEPSKHVLINVGHAFMWKIVANAALNDKKRKTLEAFLW